MNKHLYVYILANSKNGILYTGMNSNLARRIKEHKQHHASGFSDMCGIRKELDSSLRWNDGVVLMGWIIQEPPQGI
jgi:predicted GIY-YIG superfamily endonuclease